MVLLVLAMTAPRLMCSPLTVLPLTLQCTPVATLQWKWMPTGKSISPMTM
jgi:hypothetical protein